MVLPVLPGLSAHRAALLQRPLPAGGAKALQVLLPIQQAVGQAPEVVPVFHLPGPLFGGQSVKLPQHPPPKPLSRVLTEFFFTCSSSS